MTEYTRWVKSVVEKALKTRRVVIISGERQCGKTTLTSQVAPAGAIIRTLDDTSLLAAAKDDPAYFVKHDKGTMIIDEIQKAPMLIPEIKRVVDKSNETGQFLITGSANVVDAPEVRESMAGRVKNVRLRTLTQGEILGTKPTFLDKAFKSKFPTQIKGCNKETVFKIALRGGYPEIVRLPKDARKEWHKDYVKSIIDHDLNNLPNVNIRRSSELKKLLEILAAWSSKYMDVNEICSGLEITKPTLLDYIGLLEKMYLIERVPAWIKSDYERVKKADKIYMCDTGLMANILNWHYDNIALDPDKYGKLIETFVFKELAVLVGLNSEYSMYQYRDRMKHEIDFIIENENNEILGIEVKGGGHISKDDFDHMIWFKNNLPKDIKFTGIVVYAGENTMSFGEGMFAVPLAAFWTDY